MPTPQVTEQEDQGDQWLQPPSCRTGSRGRSECGGPARGRARIPLHRDVVSPATCWTAVLATPTCTQPHKEVHMHGHTHVHLSSHMYARTHRNIAEHTSRHMGHTPVHTAELTHVHTQDHIHRNITAHTLRHMGHTHVYMCTQVHGGTPTHRHTQVDAHTWAHVAHGHTPLNTHMHTGAHTRAYAQIHACTYMQGAHRDTQRQTHRYRGVHTQAGGPGPLALTMGVVEVYTGTWAHTGQAGDHGHLPQESHSSHDTCTHKPGMGTLAHTVTHTGPA